MSGMSTSGEDTQITGQEIMVHNKWSKVMAIIMALL